MVERVTHNGDLYGIIVRQEYSTEGVEFFTSETFPLQLGINSRKEGEIIEPHQHKAVNREITRIQEVLFFREGQAEVTLFTDEQTPITSVVVEAGDVIMFAKGGHSLKMLADTELVEVKQGPYLGDEDKERFNGPDQDAT